MEATLVEANGHNNDNIKKENGNGVVPTVNKKKLKHQKKKDQKKRQKQQKKVEDRVQQQYQNGEGERSHTIKEETDETQDNSNNNTNENKNNNTDNFTIDESDPSFELFSKLVKHFDNPYEDEEEKERIEKEEKEQEEEKIKKEKEEQDKKNKDSDKEDSDDDKKDGDDSDAENGKKLSNKERKRQRKLHLPILKQMVDRPDVVELHDVNSPNPAYLIAMKSYRNTISVPAHWCQKKKYLQGKRGFVKPPFELPAFIAATGITKIREAIIEKEKELKSKQKQRERVQPKLRKMGIDYEILRDAFFVHQTKPNLSIQGNLYYEGKEFEVTMKNKKPGVLSAELKSALGMIEGYPPPWLIYMQTIGPPPSYPNLKIPGVNAPIPEGAQYGFHPGGWGRPVLNEFGKPLYENLNKSNGNGGINQSREYWGELLPESEDFNGEEGDEEVDENGEEGVEQSIDEEDATDGISSVPSGLETPDVVNIKKSNYSQQQPQQYQQQPPKELYQVIEQQNRNSATGGLMESSHRYNLSTTIKTANQQAHAHQQAQHQQQSTRVDVIKSQRTAPVEATFDPSEIENGNEIDEELLKKKYEQATQALQPKRQKEDVSDIIDEQNKKRKSQSQKDEKQKKFKF